MKTGYKMVLSGFSGGVITILLAGLGYFIYNHISYEHTKAAQAASNNQTVPANNVVIRILPSTTDTETQRQVLAAIQQLISTHPSDMDASLFVQTAFRQVNVNLPRTIAEQAQVGTSISSVADLQAGDLVFFDLNDAGTNSQQTSASTGATPTFVGIYLGHNEFAAVTSNGPTVVQLGPPYWLGKFIYGRRVL